jgi:hypothetical protein
MSNVAATLAYSLGLGTALGFTIMLAVTVICLPISLMMNRAIYHSAAMRFVIGALSALFSVVLFGVLMVQRILFWWSNGRSGWDRAHFFGFMPLVQSEPFVDESFSWRTLFDWCRHPFMMWFTESDVPAYQSAISAGLGLLDVSGALVPNLVTLQTAKGTVTVDVGSRPDAVCEGLFEGARIVAALEREQPDPNRPHVPAWSVEVAKLTDAATRVFA